MMLGMMGYTLVITQFAQCTAHTHTHTHTHTHKQLPLLVPSLSYSFETMVECLDDMGRTEDISVFVLKKSNPIPLITAVIKMPVSESVIVV